MSFWESCAAVAAILFCYYVLVKLVLVDLILMPLKLYLNCVTWRLGGRLEVFGIFAHHTEGSVASYFAGRGVERVEKQGAAYIITFRWFWNAWRELWRILKPYDSSSAECHFFKERYSLPRMTVTPGKIKLHLGHDATQHLNKNDKYITKLGNKLVSEGVVLELGGSSLTVRFVENENENLRKEKKIIDEVQETLGCLLFLFPSPKERTTIGYLSSGIFNVFRRVFIWCSDDNSSSLGMTSGEGAAFFYMPTGVDLLQNKSFTQWVQKTGLKLPQSPDENAVCLVGPKDTISRVSTWPQKLQVQTFPVSQTLRKMLGKRSAIDYVDEKLNANNLGCSWLLCSNKTGPVVKVFAYPHQQNKIRDMFSSLFDETEISLEQNQAKFLTSKAGKSFMEDKQRENGALLSPVLDVHGDKLFIVALSSSLQTMRLEVVQFLFEHACKASWDHCVEDTLSGLAPWQMRFLTSTNAVPRFCEHLAYAPKACASTGSLTFTAPIYLLDRCKAEVWKLVAGLSQQKISIERAQAERLRRNRAEVEAALNQKNLECYWEVGERTVMITACQTDQRGLREFFCKSITLKVQTAPPHTQYKMDCTSAYTVQACTYDRKTNNNYDRLQQSTVPHYSKFLLDKSHHDGLKTEIDTSLVLDSSSLQLNEKKQETEDTLKPNLEGPHNHECHSQAKEQIPNAWQSNPEGVNHQKQIQDVTVQKQLRASINEEHTEDLSYQEPSGYTNYQEPLGDATDQKLLGDATDQKLLGDATDQKIIGDATDQKLLGDATDQKLSGDATDQQLLGDAIDQKLLSDTTDQKLILDATDQEQFQDLIYQEPLGDATDQEHFQATADPEQLRYVAYKEQFQTVTSQHGIKDVTFQRQIAEKPHQGASHQSVQDGIKQAVTHHEPRKDAFNEDIFPNTDDQSLPRNVTENSQPNDTTLLEQSILTTQSVNSSFTQRDDLEYQTDVKEVMPPYTAEGSESTAKMNDFDSSEPCEASERISQCGDDEESALNNPAMTSTILSSSPIDDMDNLIQTQDPMQQDGRHLELYSRSMDHGLGQGTRPTANSFSQDPRLREDDLKPDQQCSTFDTDSSSQTAFPDLLRLSSPVSDLSAFHRPEQSHANGSRIYARSTSQLGISNFTSPTNRPRQTSQPNLNSRFSPPRNGTSQDEDCGGERLEQRKRHLLDVLRAEVESQSLQEEQMQHYHQMGMTETENLTVLNESDTSIVSE